MKNIHQEIRRELSLSEQVLWYGQPRQGLVVRGTDAFLIPFSLLWCGVAIFWEMAVLEAPNAPDFFALWGLPFVGVGVYMVIGRFFAEAKLRGRTYYAVTNERVLIVSGLLSRQVKSLSLRTLSDISLTEDTRGDGSISFGGGSTPASLFGGMSVWPGSDAHVGPRFDLIPTTKSVFEVIRNAQLASS
jgi:hypothetical protein